MSGRQGAAGKDERPRPRLVTSERTTAAAAPDRASGEAIGNGQRALWTFLMFTLVGPFVGALMVLVLALGAGLLQTGPTSLKGLALPALLAKASAWAVTSYVWSALPAAVAGAAAAAWVVLRGNLPWLASASFAAIATSVAAAIAGGTARDHLTFIAGLAALAAIAVHVALRRGRIIV